MQTLVLILTEYFRKWTGYKVTKMERNTVTVFSNSEAMRQVLHNGAPQFFSSQFSGFKDPYPPYHTQDAPMRMRPSSGMNTFPPVILSRSSCSDLVFAATYKPVRHHETGPTNPHRRPFSATTRPTHMTSVTRHAPYAGGFIIRPWHMKIGGEQKTALPISQWRVIFHIWV